MQRIMIGLLGLVVGITSAFGTTFTLKSSVSGVDFDWSLGSNYEGDPAQGPAAGDTIVIPTGVTAIANEAAAAKEGTCGICNIQIGEGGTFQVYTNGVKRTKTYVQTITGTGTVRQPAKDAYDLEIQKTCVFDGKLVGALNYRIYQAFTLTDVDQSGLTGSPLISENARFRLPRLGKDGSILGTGSFNMNSGSVVEYIGGPDITGESYSPAVWSGTAYIFDAGAYGGFTYSGKAGSSAVQWNLTLTGSNTTAAVYSGYRDINTSSSYFGPLAIAKEGTGTWLMKKNGNNKYGSVVEVREGTLAFDDVLAPMGVNCSLGLANSLYKFGKTAMTDANKVDYAILLGGDRTEGFLQSAYVGNTIVSNYDRLVEIKSAGGFKSGTGRVLFSGITAAGAGEKTLILDGDVQGYDAVTAVTNGAGVVSIEKRGTGTWTVRPPCDITGKLTVKEGRLNLGVGPTKTTYDWYRLRMKSNAFNDPMFKETVKEYYETIGKTTLPDSTKRRIAVAEFMFFDAEGNRQCVYPMRHYKKDVDYNPSLGRTEDQTYHIAMQSTNEYALLCQPGQFSIENMAVDGGLFRSSTRAFCALFEGGADQTDEAYAAGTFHYNDWFDLTPSHVLDINDESTWVGIILRPTNNTPPLVACDFVQQDGDNGQWTGRNLTAFDVCGSTDGLTWDPLLDVHLDMLGYGAASGAGPTTRKITAANLAKCFQLSKTGPELSTEAFDLAATVSVAPGATLACFGTVSISSIKLSDAGMGTIEGANVSLAEEGSFEVEKLMSSSKTFHTSLKGLSGADNLARWKATVNGVEQNYDVAYDAATGDVTVSKRGLMLLVR